MSVASHAGSKRLLGAEEGFALGEAPSPGAKRGRWREQPGRCCQAHRAHAHAGHDAGRATLLALASLFPGMSDQEIAGVLEQYGSDVDAAIQHLNELQLGRQRRGEPGEAAATSAAASPAGAPSTPSAAAAAAGTTVPAAISVDEARPPAPEQWVDELVREMASATSVDDARARASRVLEAVEREVLRHARRQHQHRRPGEAEAAGRPGTPGGAPQPRDVSELLRENAVLKRAVGIQAARLQELGAREAEVAALRDEVQAARGRLAALEQQNYALQVHLQHAAGMDHAEAGAPGLGGFRNPDVF